MEYYDEDNDRIFVFVTNNMRLAASTIAQIYKERWKIELFFKALKQNLKIKTFFWYLRDCGRDSNLDSRCISKGEPGFAII